jgi:eukaryotic-like serine/threonine-protein kinase
MNDSPLETTNHLVRGCLARDGAAEEALFERYFERLGRLIEQRLARRMAARIDASDVALSAYRSLFMGLRRGTFSFRARGDLWKLLVTIALRKLYRQVEQNSAKRRDVGSEAAVNWQHLLANQAPSADEAAAVLDQYDHLLKQLDDLGQAVVDLRLQGFLADEIASQLDCSQRTVRRHIERARAILMPTEERAKRANHRPADGARDIKPRPTLAHPAAVSRIDFKSLTLLKQIGEGGAGKVYLARSPEHNEPIAVKFLKRRFWRRASVLDRFLHEAEVLSALEHPHIVRIHGLGTTPAGGWFIAMERLGDDLGRRLKAGRIELRLATKWTRQVALAIAFSHAHGIVHCDLKPSNVLLDHSGNARVVDFGLAEQATPRRSSIEALAGTPAYMAPEQIDSRFGNVGPATDVWGLGALLFTLIAGRPPFDGACAEEVLTAITSDAPVAVREALAMHSVPDSLATLCLECLGKNARQRQLTAAEIARMLDTR